MIYLKQVLLDNPDLTIWVNRSDVWQYFRELHAELREELTEFIVGGISLPPNELKSKLVERIAVINFIEQLLREKEDHNG